MIDYEDNTKFLAYIAKEVSEALSPHIIVYRWADRQVIYDKNTAVTATIFINDNTFNVQSDCDVEDIDLSNPETDLDGILSIVFSVLRTTSEELIDSNKKIVDHAEGLIKCMSKTLQKKSPKKLQER